MVVCCGGVVLVVMVVVVSQISAVSLFRSIDIFNEISTFVFSSGAFDVLFALAGISNL